MSGADLTNNLVGIRMGFRKIAIAISGGIQQMFYAFCAHDEHRDYLRFIKYVNNAFEKPTDIKLNKSSRFRIHAISSCSHLWS